MPATDFHVNGPTNIYWGTGGSSPNPATKLGFTDNEDLIRITMRDHVRTFTRNDTGDMISEAVVSGTTATIDFTMVSWDQTELEKLIKRVRQGGTPAAGIANEGMFATVGGVVVNSGTAPRTVSLKIEPTTAGKTVYMFGNLMLASGPEYIDFGNTLKRIALSFVSVAITSDQAQTLIATTTTKA